MSIVKTKQGYSIPNHQYNGDYLPAKSEIVIVPSTNTPAFGGYFTIDYKEHNVILHRGVLQFNTSAITVMTSGMFVPAQFWVDHIDWVQGGNIIYTTYPLDQFLRLQVFNRDEDRFLENTAAGNYASTSTRTTMASAAASYYLSLNDYFRQAKTIPILENAHELQLRVYMQPLANITSGTGTATASITSVNFLAKVTRLRESEAVSLRNEMVLRKQLNFKFNDLKYQSFTVQSGVSSTSLVLNSIVGPVTYLMFVVRPSASLTGNSAFAFTAISNYAYLNSAGQNIVGGQTISSSEGLLLIGNDIGRSTYLAENSLGLTDNHANVYVYAFNADSVESELNAVSSGYHMFTGTEQLQIAFTGSLGANVQVDVYAYVESILGVSKNGVVKAIYKF